jgi:hypothetical protein
VVWLGLALGAIYGSYFIGFFSGKYVGFEDARTASGGEVPKLALNEEIPDRSPKEWDNVYGKLGGAAVVGQDERANANGEQATSDKKAAEPKAPDQRIVKAVQEGRTIYENIVNFVRFQLSTNFGALLTIVGAPLLGLPSPLKPIQVLWVAMIMDGPPAIALGLDPANSDVMSRPPSRVG